MRFPAMWLDWKCRHTLVTTMKTCGWESTGFGMPTYVLASGHIFRGYISFNSSWLSSLLSLFIPIWKSWPAPISLTIEIAQVFFDTDSLWLYKRIWNDKSKMPYSQKSICHLIKAFFFTRRLTKFWGLKLRMELRFLFVMGQWGSTFDMNQA